MPTSLRLDQAYLDALDRALRRAVSEVVQEELKQSRGAACKPVMDALQRAFPDDQTVADLARRIIPARQRDERVPAALTALLIDFAQRYRFAAVAHQAPADLARTCKERDALLGTLYRQVAGRLLLPVDDLAAAESALQKINAYRRRAAWPRLR